MIDGSHFILTAVAWKPRSIRCRVPCAPVQPIAPEDYCISAAMAAIAWISVAAAPIFDGKGIVSGGVVAISDIDHQKRTDSNLHRSDERFRRLIEHSTVGMIIGDFEGGISYANPAILNLLGYTSEEVAAGALRWNELTPAEFADADEKAIRGTSRYRDRNLLPEISSRERRSAASLPGGSHDDSLS